MKKLLGVAQLMFKVQLAWRFDVLCNMLFTATRIVFAVIVWGVIYGQNDSVAGLSFEAMLSYYVVSSFLAQLESTHGSADEITARIRDGSFSKYMVVPLSPEAHFLAMSAGAKLLHGAFILLAGALCAALFRIPLALTHEPLLIVGAIVMELMGLVFTAQLNFLIGILAFKLEDASALRMVKENIVAFLTGAIVPLALLPDFLVGAMRLLPFYYVTYAPSMLLIGREREVLGTGLLVLGLWMLLLLFANRACYEGMRRRYDGVGI